MSQPYGPPPPPPPAKRGRTVPLWMFLVAVIATMFVSCGLGVGIGASGSESLSVAEPATDSDAPQPIQGRKATSTAEPADEPTEEPTEEPEPKPSKLPKHKKITAREWAQIEKDPDAHAGERIIVHGWVTQFDAATGQDAFRADAGGVRVQPEYGFVDYPTNTVFTGNASELADIVQDDLFRARVTVLGSMSYGTQIGGETTVPLLQVDSIRVTGSLS